ncbi:MAG: protein translocase subunit SecD [Anaerolineae bacterium]|nr:protein translocase subunit SecD [Anaerolineae bacterium]
MSQRIVRLVIIAVILIFAIWINIPNNGGIHIGEFQRDLKTVLGLDLQGGMQVLLEADLPEDQTIDADALENARKILENRSNGLGVSEVSFQVAGNRRIVGEFPGLTKTDEVVAVLKETGQLEFVDLGDTWLPEGTIIKTDHGGSSAQPISPTPTATTEGTDTQPQEDKIWHTVMTGDQIKQVGVQTDQLGKPIIAFTLKEEGTKIFAEYTTANVNKILGIALDKRIISAPRVQEPITKGEGTITGEFTTESANNLAVQLRYGSLPIPLKVIQSRVIGPTLGQDSLKKSMIAGVVGFILISLFMLFYYRLPGFVAILALVTYGVITLAIYKLLPVTLTLPGIAGLMLSTGGALDANILIFERFKEELRAGRKLEQALTIGWRRAWPSIRDSNIATLITSIIIFMFGSAFGASIVKGFALTLALGIVVSLFGALVVTRAFLNEVLNIAKPTNYSRWFGL